jgi:DNA-binding ferritin-like protein
MFSPALASSVLKAKHDLTITAQLSHWSVRGPDFYEFHLLFERIYEEADKSTDALVEVLRGLGYTPTFSEFAGPGGTLPSFDGSSLVDLLLTRAMEYYARIISFRSTLQDEPRAVGLVNLLEDLAQTCNTIIYLLSASKGN